MYEKYLLLTAPVYKNNAVLAALCVAFSYAGVRADSLIQRVVCFGLVSIFLAPTIQAGLELKQSAMIGISIVFATLMILLGIDWAASILGQ